MSSPLNHSLTFLASLRLTVVLLVLSLVLIFAATLDQVHLGVWGVQEKYFHSCFIYNRIAGTRWLVPIFPGGYLLGGALIANLLAAHLCRFRFSWKKAGIWLTHLGLLLLLVGEGVSGLLQHDDQMRLDVGQTRRYSESFRLTELAIVETTHPGYDQVVAVPAPRLAHGGTLQHPLLPFVIKPVAYYPNAALRLRPPGTAGLATAGTGIGTLATPLPVTTNPDEANWPTAYVELAGPAGSLGTFLVSTLSGEPEAFVYQGRTWQLALRPERDYLPFAITLKAFTHANYPGTDIPRDFASTIRLLGDDGRTDRNVRISMNRPLRFGGRAFYQAGYANNDRTAVLQVVRNPSWQIPYLACGLMVAGLLLQFGIHLYAFFRRPRHRAPGVAAPVAPAQPAAFAPHAR